MWRAVVSQPLDRTHKLEALGEVDREAGEFWVDSPFKMPRLGHNLSAFEANRLFLNVDGRRFIDASFASQANIDSDSRSVVAADFNADGAADLLVGSVGGGPLRLFLNKISTENHFLRLKLVGSDSNRAAVGAHVVLTCGERIITRDLFPANGFMGQSPVELLIGIGSAAKVDRITIRWPSGRMQTIENTPADQTLEVVEAD